MGTGDNRTSKQTHDTPRRLGRLQRTKIEPEKDKLYDIHKQQTTPTT